MSTAGKKTTLLWFRQDLRVTDNPALAAAAAQGGQVIPIYILNDQNAGNWSMGAASRVWLYHALVDLNQSLNGHLCIYSGDPQSILDELIAKYSVSEVHWNRCYEPWRIQRDKNIKSSLTDRGIDVHSHNASLLWEPWEISKKDGTPYKVFTPFYKKGCLQHSTPRQACDVVKGISYVDETSPTDLNRLNLLPKHLDWHENIVQHWDISEAGAQNRLSEFLDSGLDSYKTGRDFPATDFVSRLSPYLHFGQISPHQVWHAACAAGLSSGQEINLDHFCSELGWREFSYYLLHQVF